MRIISTDGIGVAALVRAAEKIQEVADEFGVSLAVIDSPVYGKAVAVTYGNRRVKDHRLAATVEDNPKIIDPDG